MRMKARHPLQGFFMHGVPSDGIVSENEYITTCIFCGKTDKFYINTDKLLFDCKVCGHQGNFLGFLEQVSKVNQENITPEHLNALALDRELPPEAFEGYEIGWDDQKFTFPTRDYEGKLVGLRWYKPGSKVWNTSDTKAGLFNAQRLKEKKDDVIFLCEGEWDTVAVNWLIKKLGKPGVAVGVPGANTFLDIWIEWFFGRDVVVLYDNDAAGKKGELTVQRQLENHVSHINYLHWPPNKSDGYDMRDLIKTKAIKKKKPKSTFRWIEEHLENVPMNMLPAAVEGPDGRPILAENLKPLEPITFSEVVESFRQLLYMPDDTPIRVLLATVLANRLHTDMVWMFFVAPPASAKSELIQSLYQCKEVVVVDQLTQNTLLSGWVTADKKDHSLLSKLDGCIMAMKDFTSVLTLPIFVQQTIFGQLRFAYDMDSTARYGHGQDRKTKAHFGIVAGVTSAIEKFGITQSILGERFLRYHLPAIDDDKTMRKSSSYMGREQEIRGEIKKAVMRYLGTHSTDLPEIPEEIFEKIRNLSRLTARMRGVVDRDDDKNVVAKPTGESPNRINKQLLAMANGLGSLEKKKVIGEFEFKIIRDIALGSCPERVEAIIAALHATPNGMCGLRDLEKATEFPYGTVKSITEDLKMLKLINIEGVGFKQYYSLTELTKEWINKSTMYATTSKSLKTARSAAAKGLNQREHAKLKPRSVQIRLPKRP